MGISEFGELIKKGAISNRLTSLQKLLHNDPNKDTIGIDMSVVIVKTIKASPNIIDLLFSEPAQPIDDLTTRVCDTLATYVKFGFKIVCVFDGMPGPLKENHAYRLRYRNHDEMRKNSKTFTKSKASNVVSKKPTV